MQISWECGASGLGRTPGSLSSDPTSTPYFEDLKFYNDETSIGQARNKLDFERALLRARTKDDLMAWHGGERKTRTERRPGEAIAFQKLFNGPHDGDPRAVAFPADGTDDLFMWVQGYEIGANLMLEKLKREHMQDWLVFPAVFLLRHSLELSLKNTIQRALDLGLIGALDTNKLWDTHNLQELARIVSGAFKRMDLNGGRKQAEWAAGMRFLREWDQADPDGTRFRYLRDPKGVPMSIPHNVDPRQVFGRAEPLLRILESVQYWFDSIEENRREGAACAEPDEVNYDE